MMLWEPACRSAHWECGADVPTGGLIAERRPPGPMGSSGRPEAPGVHGQGAAGSVGWAVVMLLFCPGCGNGLIVEEGQRCHRFACNTCPYVHNITRKVGPRRPPGTQGRSRRSRGARQALTLTSPSSVLCLGFASQQPLARTASLSEAPRSCPRRCFQGLCRSFLF